MYGPYGIREDQWRQPGWAPAVAGFPPSQPAMFTSSRKSGADSISWSAVTVTLDLNENPGDLGGANRKLIHHGVG